MKRIVFSRAALLLAVFCLASAAHGQKLKADEITARHLDSIGTAEARAAAKTRMAVGEATVTFISQKNQSAQGRVVMASTGDRHFFGLNLNAADYPHEKFSYDGLKAKVATVINGERSFFGNFVDANNVILRESLLGGALASSWAIGKSEHGKVSGGGIKKIDGREVYAVDYSPKGGGDIDITMYFDKETFRHVRTEYKRTSSAGIGRTIDESARQSETRLKVTEDFGDFKTVEGLTLPHTYKLRYSISGARGTTEVEWAYNLSEFTFNKPLDDKTFDADAK